MVNAAVHYACLALMDIAVHGSDGAPVRSADITRRNEIPGPYLNQILRTLKSTGWISATRGSQGGYQMIVPPDSITLLEINEAITCSDAIAPTGESEPVAEQTLKEHWRAADEQSRKYLSQVRLGDVIRHCRESDQPMFYI